MEGAKRNDGGNGARILVRMAGLGAEGDLALRPQGADMLAAHYAITTKSCKAQQKLGKLVNQRRHAAHATSLMKLPETVRPS